MSKKPKAERTEREMAQTSLEMLIDFYARDMELRNMTPDSRRTNVYALRKFSVFLGESCANAIAPAQAKDYVASLQARTSRWEGHPNRGAINGPLSPYTIRKTVKILRGFGAWMKREGYGNPFDELEIPTVPRLIKDVLTNEEIDLILSCINPNTDNGARNYAMVLLMLGSGPRISEVASLRLENLNLQKMEAKLMGKGRKERMIPIAQRAGRAIARYVQAFRPKPVNPSDEFVFLSVDGYPLTRNAMEGIVRRLRITSGVSKLHAHLFRHTFAVNFIAGGGDVETLRRMLGHESLDVTQRYLSGLQSEQVRLLYQKVSPLDRMYLGSEHRRFGKRGATADL